MCFFTGGQQIWTVFRRQGQETQLVLEQQAIILGELWWELEFAGRWLADLRSLTSPCPEQVPCFAVPSRNVVQPFPNEGLTSHCSLQCVQTLVGHTGGVWSSQMRDSIVISGSTDRTLKVWNADTGECVHTLYGHTSTVRCMHLHGNRYGSEGVQGPTVVWGR